MLLLVSLLNTTGTNTTDAARSVVSLAANPPPLLRQTSHPSDCCGVTGEHGGRYFDTTVEVKGVSLESCKCDRADSMWLWNTSCVLVGVSRTSPSLLKLSK